MHIHSSGTVEKRSYFKTINVPAVTSSFSQPTLSANGTLGGSSFAVAVSNFTSNGKAECKNAFGIFDGNNSTYTVDGVLHLVGLLFIIQPRLEFLKLFMDSFIHIQLVEMCKAPMIIVIGQLY